jgi:hypothetical protein
MRILESAIARSRHRLIWLMVLALPIIIAACNNGGGGGGTGY